MKTIKKITFSIITLLGLCSCSFTYEKNPIYEYNKIIENKVSFSRVNDNYEISYHLNSYTSFRQSNYIDLYLTKTNENNVLDGKNNFTIDPNISFGLFSPNNKIQNPFDTNNSNSFILESNLLKLDTKKVNNTYLFNSKNISDEDLQTPFKIGENTYHILIILDVDHFDYEYGVFSICYSNLYMKEIDYSDKMIKPEDFKTTYEYINIYFAKTTNGYIFNDVSLKKLTKEIKDFNKKYNGYLNYINSKKEN